MRHNPSTSSWTVGVVIASVCGVMGSPPPASLAVAGPRRICILPDERHALKGGEAAHRIDAEARVPPGRAPVEKVEARLGAGVEVRVVAQALFEILAQLRVLLEHVVRHFLHYVRLRVFFDLID